MGAELAREEVPETAKSFAGKLRSHSHSLSSGSASCLVTLYSALGILPLLCPLIFQLYSLTRRHLLTADLAIRSTMALGL
ncbi:hypothetical protein GC387_30860 [Pseudomonas sp. MWU12-2323]|nr:hypothetical protein [Pseudomonas sp. MWU12-2323]